jgi:hypothetical protein
VGSSEDSSEGSSESMVGGQLGGQLGGRLGGCCPRFSSEGSDRAPPSPGCAGVFEWNTHSRPARIATIPSRCFVIQAARRSASHRRTQIILYTFQTKVQRYAHGVKTKTANSMPFGRRRRPRRKAVLVTKQILPL